MYFPYLRGKQFELIALREMADKLGPKIVPVIEPVRGVDSSGLRRCLAKFTDGEVQVPIVVLNPSVGDIKNGFVVPEIANFMNEPETSNPRVGLIIDEETEIEPLVRNYLGSPVAALRPTLIVNSVPHNESLVSLRELTPEFVLCEDSRTVQRKIQRELRGAKRVSLNDAFATAPRNAEYLDRGASVFSEEHLFYRQEGFEGFSDYLTIGSSFVEGGFSPRAVAIHWTYAEARDEPIMIRHFTSEMNPNETANVAGKFLEAAEKLVRFMASHESTEATKQMELHVQNETYPGLGVIKKYSIQNHLELMARVLEKHS